MQMSYRTLLVDLQWEDIPIRGTHRAKFKAFILKLRGSWYAARSTGEHPVSPDTTEAEE